MREILFRAKRMDESKMNGWWVEGFIYRHDPPLQAIVPVEYIPEEPTWYICQTGFADWNMPRGVDFIKVDPSTVCQYTGLKDCNGKRIFEGDILESSFSTYSNIYIVYDEFKASFGWLSTDFIRTQGKAREITNYDMSLRAIIGNILDNPELLEV